MKKILALILCVLTVLPLFSCAAEENKTAPATNETVETAEKTEEEKKNGFVTTNMTNEQMTRLICEENGVTVAKDGDKVVAFALAASWDYWKEWPFFQYMIEILPENSYNGEVLTTKNSYQYGPVCVDKDYRGTGVFEKVFFASLESMESRFPYMVTFVNKVNPRSYEAHTRKAKLDEVCSFSYNNNNYWMFGCKTSNRP